MIAGIALDDWKLPIFKKHLDAGGFQYSEHPGVVKGTLLLRVQTDQVAELCPVVEKANSECAAWKRRQKLN